MMRRFLLIALGLGFVYAVFFMSPQGAPGGENPYTPLYNLMDDHNAKVVEGELQYWAHLQGGEDIGSPGDLERKADDILSRMGVLESSAPKSSGETGSGDSSSREEHYEAQMPLREADLEETQEINVEKREKELPGYGSLQLMLQDKTIEGSRELHLLVTVISEGRSSSLAELASRLPGILNLEAKEDRLTFSITGHLDRKLEGEEKDKFAEQLTHQLQGEGVETFREDGMISVTGYTPILDNYLQYDGGRLNFNLALRYDEYLDKTVVFAATPLIPRCY